MLGCATGHWAQVGRKVGILLNISKEPKCGSTMFLNHFILKFALDAEHHTTMIGLKISSLKFRIKGRH